MKKRKTLKELTIKDNFMFSAVMCDEMNCKAFLEMVLQIPIDRVEVSKEKSIIYHPEYKGVRLDVYAKDEKNTHYDIEMQAIKQTSIGKRARYYHSQIDMELLFSGEEYDKLPDSYVIFVCDFDPFGERKYCYTFANQCLENPALNQKDGCKTIFLSTYGENESDIPISMVNFLKFVRADLAGSVEDFEDEFVKRLQNSVQQIKTSREMEDRFMLFQEMLRDERTEGKAEVVIEFLEEIAAVSDELRGKILNETNLETLTGWAKLAAKAESIEQFIEKM